MPPVPPSNMLVFCMVQYKSLDSLGAIIGDTRKTAIEICQLMTNLNLLSFSVGELFDLLKNFIDQLVTQRGCVVNGKQKE